MPKFTSIKEMIPLMPQFFVPEATAGMNATIQLELTGNDGGLWNMVVANKQLKINEGQAASPNMTVKMSGADYLAMVNGEANPMQMFMQGKVKVGGDMSLITKLQAMFNM
jgi:putative sterol carrier protein